MAGAPRIEPVKPDHQAWDVRPCDPKVYALAIQGNLQGRSSQVN